MWEVKKDSIFLSAGHGIMPSSGCKARETMAAKCELQVFFEERRQLTKFA